MTPNLPNRSGELVSCAGCGRDTTNKSALCMRCLKHGLTQIEDARDRRHHPVVLSTPPIREDHYDEDSRPDPKLLRFYLGQVQRDLGHPELERRQGKLKLRRLLIKRLMEIHKRPIRENREDEHTRP